MHIDETINPARALRDWQGQMDEAKRDRLKAAQAAFFLASTAELCARCAQHLQEPLSPHNPRPFALAWLMSQELTRRGIAPQWRGLPAHIADEPAPNIPDNLLLPGAARPLSSASRRHRLLRWIDLDWLAASLGRSHIPAHTRWRRLFALGLDEVIAEQVANSEHPPHKICAMLGVRAPHTLSLRGLLPRDAAERLRTAGKRSEGKTGRQLGEQCLRSARPLSPEHHQARVRWVQAIELAGGSPSEAAVYYGWMTGTPVTRQTAHVMRQKLASQLGLRTEAWR